MYKDFKVQVGQVFPAQPDFFFEQMKYNLVSVVQITISIIVEKRNHMEVDFCSNAKVLSALLMSNLRREV